MRLLRGLLLLLCLHTPVVAAAHLLAWEGRNLTAADVGYRIEQCPQTPQGCVFVFVTNVPRTTVQYLAQGLRPQRRYCWRVKSTTSPFSNVVCTP